MPSGCAETHTHTHTHTRVVLCFEAREKECRPSQVARGREHSELWPRSLELYYFLFFGGLGKKPNIMIPWWVFFSKSREKALLWTSVGGKFISLLSWIKPRLVLMGGLYPESSSNSQIGHIAWFIGLICWTVPAALYNQHKRNHFKLKMSRVLHLLVVCYISKRMPVF